MIEVIELERVRRLMVNHLTALRNVMSVAITAHKNGEQDVVIKALEGMHAATTKILNAAEQFEKDRAGQ